ncbi:hypothetical protein CEN45_10635 [Fischerella thermalis CCMEE 5198]|jgi:hypothetical protein|uniref:hypothetical protein n=1 Tax=Fischerella thermalis TaxID=372787 RepID=UPI000C7F9687|nr:hypothetical protein [Fischerella thermalis]PMB05746.1 hypothetical protein CI594_02860 [Fischerella thermalis CCMEE 5196]PMB53222.1 hypothetical protein CEN39_05550 [Fischerella thermalis CCMEE 5201]MBF1988368.1 hypothetical protein [Fischerella thermalis M58_A2018_009]MBF2059529.1 hypothetical protein [Fischerella thermalis M66_A2018_004]MBF2068950.1 hypothetical protein [Fischerella thermalis M48_A2018_028]
MFHIERWRKKDIWAILAAASLVILPGGLVACNFGVGGEAQEQRENNTNQSESDDDDDDGENNQRQNNDDDDDDD